jgi:hypothetical protein
MTMVMFARAGFAVLLAIALVGQAPAGDEAAPDPAQSLVAFGSDDGIARFVRSVAKADFPALANQFEAQSNIAFCGPTTAAIVLNAMHGRSGELPRDRSRLRADDLRNVPSGFDLTVARFTQDNVIDKGRKTRAQVLGELVVIDGKPVRDGGYQLRQFDELLRAHDLVTRLVVVDDARSEAGIRVDFLENLRRTGDYVVVNYRRSEVGQRGGAHISPLGAYDADSDSVLVLDVNPASAGWVWMPLATLIRGMRTFDTVENRGYILVRSR